MGFCALSSDTTLGSAHGQGSVKPKSRLRSSVTALPCIICRREETPRVYRNCWAMRVWLRSGSICTGMTSCSTTRRSKSAKRCDGALLKEQRHWDPSQMEREQEERRSMQKTPDVRAKLPPVGKRHILSLFSDPRSRPFPCMPRPGATASSLRAS
jgi:hypothetical protein